MLTRSADLDVACFASISSASIQGHDMPRRPPRTADDAKHRGHTFADVEAIGRALPDVEVTTAWGQPALKVNGKMFVCVASHKSAEPNSLVVMMAFGDRDALVEDDPDTYYVKEHYLNYPCVVVRLTRVRLDALRDLVAGAHRFVNIQTSAKSDAGRRRSANRRSPKRR
jgi:hypothetical protein